MLVLLGGGDAHVARDRVLELHGPAGSCWASAKPATGRARPRPSPSGSRAARADGRSRSSTAVRRSAARSRRSSCSGPITTSAAGGRRSSSPARSGSCGWPLFRWLYRPPEDHPRLSPEERAYILAGRDGVDTGDATTAATARCCACRRRGATSSARPSPIRSGSSSPTGSPSTSSPSGFTLEESLAGLLGAVPGRGPRQSVWRRRVEPAHRARLSGRRGAQDDRDLGGLGMMLLIPAVWTLVVRAIVTCIRDLHVFLRRVLDDHPEPAGRPLPVRRRWPRSAAWAAPAPASAPSRPRSPGYVADRYSFEPILIGASFLPLVAHGGGAAARA